MKKLSILYVRTSTIDQNIERQLVQESKYDKVIEDRVSGKVPLFEREGGKELHKSMRGIQTAMDLGMGNTAE